MKDMWVLLGHERSLKMFRKLIQTNLTWQKRTTQCNTQVVTARVVWAGSVARLQSLAALLVLCIGFRADRPEL